MKIDLIITDTDTDLLPRLRSGLRNRKGLHARIAGAAESSLKRDGKVIARKQHGSAEDLGARPTRHLQKAYQAIKSSSDNDSAMVDIPRKSRLRAAFGDYILRPGSGKKYLTVPAHKDAYGHKAGFFDDLIFVRVGPRMTPTLSRKTAGGEGLEVMFWLVKTATVHEDRTLIRMDLLEETARDTAAEFFDELLKNRLLKKGGPA